MSMIEYNKNKECYCGGFMNRVAESNYAKRIA